MSVSILLVEDDKNARTALAELLRDEGYSVVDAADGQAGGEVFCDAQPELVLADIKMPGIDGLELCRRIRASEHPCPVVLVTGSTRLEQTGQAPRFDNRSGEARAAGAVDCVEKPIDFDQLLAIAAEHLPRS